MGTSTLVMDKAQQLAAAGHHAEVVEFLGMQDRSELDDSPELALLYGTAQARLGRHEEGLRWLDRAVEGARRQDAMVVERHALNARSVVALVSGRIDQAADNFTQALMAASRDGDFATTARCSNNLGIIGHLRGRHAEALGSWTLAIAAFERAGLRQGVAECHHNLAITYREQGAWDRALAEADQALADAEAAGDQALYAMALRGRAEIRVARGELELARRDLDTVHDLRRHLPDPVGEVEDLRITAAVLAAEGQFAIAVRGLQDVVRRAEALTQPQLQAEASRDLAVLLRRLGRNAEAEAAARAAKAIFTDLGAEAEVRRLASHDWNGAFAAELRGSLTPLHEAQKLVDAGRYADLLAYLDRYSRSEVEQSPMLALLCGIAHSRLGRLVEGWQWAMAALSRARAIGDRKLEVRALNVCGAVALESGGIGEATQFFTEAQEAALQQEDMATVGRCANNLGIIANMQGDYGSAVGAYTRAIAAYQKAHFTRGIAEAQHNLGIAYREQGQLNSAMEAADAALREAERLGDRQLSAQALAGRAEIQTVRGEPELAILEAEHALTMHRELNDAVRETEDMRILAVALGAAGKTAEAEGLLREVMERATEHQRPLLVAVAGRDLAQLMARSGDVVAAKRVAIPARATFDRLGAKGELGKLDAVLAGSVQARLQQQPGRARP